MVRLTGWSVARWTAAALAAAAFIGGNLGCGPTSNDTDTGDGPKGPGPWPTDAYKNYSVDYGIDWVQSVGIDDGDNLWLLRDREIGVLRPGETKPLWVKNLGQAREPFGKNAPAMGSTVICGGAAGRAYVGYWTYDLDDPYRQSPDDVEFTRGDLDVVALSGDGVQITLETHLSETTDHSGYHIGIRNSNDWHYDEDRSVLTCQRVMHGPFKGELYIGTNHGVTRIRGLTYNAHRHPVWDVNGSLRIGYSYGLGIGQNGDVLIANQWKVAIITPPEALEDFEKNEKSPWQLDTWAEELNSLEKMDEWRAFQQLEDGRYFLGSEAYGLWQMERTQWTGDANFKQVKGAPSKHILALAAAEDGSLFVGTEDQGLWRMLTDGTFEKVGSVNGKKITQLVYDPNVSPPMLLVVADATLQVVRGH